MITNQTEHRTRKVYSFILNYKLRHDGNSPTIREIGAGCGISSTSMVGFYLAQLVKAGKIRQTSRRIEVVGGKWRYG